MSGAKMAVVYHASCMDGAAAAATVYYLSFSNIDFFALPPSESFEARHYNLVMVLDMTLPKDNIVDLMEAGSTVQIVDHHITGFEKTKWFEGYKYWPNNSGCVATWKTLTKSKVPKSLMYVEDRDLWKWKLPNSKELNAYIQAQDRDIPRLSKFLFGTFKPNKAAVEIGREILKAQDALVEEQASMALRVGDILFVNATTLQSEIGHCLLEREKDDSSVAVIYSHRPWGKVRVSLRSKENGPDVSRTASIMGGGGHKHSAGMTVTLREFEKFRQDLMEGKC